MKRFKFTSLIFLLKTLIKKIKKIIIVKIFKEKNYRKSLLNIEKQYINSNLKKNNKNTICSFI